MTLSDVQAAFLEQIDIDESYRFAKELEQFKSNPALGYRTLKLHIIRLFFLFLLV